jgi:hypothetical protein
MKFLHDSSTFSLTDKVNSSGNSIELSVAIIFNGCGVICGNATFLSVDVYQAIFLSISAIDDFHDQVFQDTNSPG